MNFQPFQPLSENQSGNVGWDHRYMDLVESLCFIQERSGYLICIPDGDIAAEDVRAAYELRDILQKGKTEVRVNHLSITVDGLGMLNKLYELHRNADHGSRLMIQQDAAASHVVLFGEAIQVGPMTKTIVGRLDMTAEELEKYIQRDNSTKAFQLRLAEVEIVEKFVQWPHDSDNRDLQYYLER